MGAGERGRAGGEGGHGPRLRSDVFDVYVFRRPAGGAAIELLQLLRADAPMASTWQPVMGHIEAGERAARAALRELEEEVGLRWDSADLLGMWALEQVWPYYLPELDCIVLSPRFVVEVSSDWRAVLNEEHTALRWIGAPWHAREGAGGAGVRAVEMFVWPGQRHAIGEILEMLGSGGAGGAGEHLRLDHRALMGG
ncbi:MAG: NUDIX domain-containing protein [Phycisphaerales bacterium]